MRKNTWMFDVSDLQTGQKLNKICFYGIDSEEAWVNCITWAEIHYGKECHAEIVDDIVYKDEDLRNREKLFLEAELEKEIDEFVSVPKKVNIMSIRKLRQNG